MLLTSCDRREKTVNCIFFFFVKLFPSYIMNHEQDLLA